MTLLITHFLPVVFLTAIVVSSSNNKAYAASDKDTAIIIDSTDSTEHNSVGSSIFDSVINPLSDTNLNIVYEYLLNSNKHEDLYFEPLVCNTNVHNEICQNFSEQNYDLSQKVVIPCGTCILMDDSSEETLHFGKGLDVQGKLLFPSSSKLKKVVTPFVFVQGIFIVEYSPEKLEFQLVGTEDNRFISHPDQSFSGCSSENNGCSVAKKAFVVAGGTLSIHGIHPSCPYTWTKLQSTVDAGPASIDPSFLSESFAESKSSVGTSLCMDEKVIVNESFNGVLGNRWDGTGGTAQQVFDGDDGYYTVSQPQYYSQGPRVFLTNMHCLVPNVHYLLRFQYRYRSSSSEQEFEIPWVKMTRTRIQGYTDWMTVNAVYSRGNINKVGTETWHEYQMVIYFTEDLVDPAVTENIGIYIAPIYSAVETIDLDNFTLERPSDAYAEALYVTRSCDELLVNGDAHLSDRYVYPFYSTGGTLQLITDADDGPSTDVTNYFRSSSRTSTWESILSQEIPIQCFVRAAIYELKAYVRVVSEEEKKVSFTLHLGATYSGIVTCPPSSNNWVLCVGKVQLTEQHELEANTTTISRLYTQVLGDDVSTVDIAKVEFKYQGGRTLQLVLQQEEELGISHCWTPGSEILITSHTIRHEDSQVAKILSVAEDDGKNIITLEDPIHEPISLEHDAHTGVEVALLSRNLKFTIDENDDVDNPLHGGHFIIMHTAAPVLQEIVGVEIDGFGQQGILGRYPIHFHMCGNVTGSVVSKNTIRNTKQRGIVVHGTNKLHVSENILHNTRGHVVVLEDGGERWNIFERNLGAVGHGVEKLISPQESDDTPSTFWITNPQNTWKGNVAAGAGLSGFWFEVKGRVRGSSASIHPDMIPNRLDLLEFIDNVSHSSVQGIQTYPSDGYIPNSLAVFENHKSYRNRNSGVFFHAGGRMSIQGGYISDNKIGVLIDMDHSDVISNTTVIGYSMTYKKVVDSMGEKASQWPATALCDEGKNNGLVGIRLDSYHDGSLFDATGSRLENVNFSGFGSGSCEGSSSLHVDDFDIRYFDTRNKMQNIQFMDDSNKIDLCKSEMQVAIWDVDGSFMEGKSGYIISDTNAIRSHPDCKSLGSDSCALFCPGTCLRTMALLVPSFYDRDALTLEITGTIDDGRSITPVLIKNFRTKKVYEPRRESTHSIFYATLPASGKYYGQFMLNDQLVWPLYTDMRYEDAVGNCGPDFKSFVIEKPNPLQCTELIQNGSFEGGNTDYWWCLSAKCLLLVADEGADGTSKSLLAPNAANEGGGRWVGLGQYLDTRCIKEGQTYTLTAKIKLQNSETGILYECNLNGYSSDSLSCPRATIRFRNRLEQPTQTFLNVGNMIENDKEWNQMSGSYLITAYDEAAYSAFLYINGVPSNVNVQIDEVSLTLIAHPTSSPHHTSSGPTSAGPISSPTVDPCAGLTKKKCEKKAEMCIYGLAKKLELCLPKKEQDCTQHKKAKTCNKAALGVCIFDGENKLCRHRCDGEPPKAKCKKIRNKSRENKICKFRKLKNPCFKCHSKSICS